MNYFIKEYKMEMFNDYIKEYILDNYGSDFEEGWSQNVEFEFETSEYNCLFVGNFYVSVYSYYPGSWEKYIEPESHAKVDVRGELFYSPKDFDDENEKTENIKFKISY